MHPPASLPQPLWMLAEKQETAKCVEFTQNLLLPLPETEEWVLQLLHFLELFLTGILEQISGALGNSGEGADGWQLEKIAC